MRTSYLLFSTLIASNAALAVQFDFSNEYNTNSIHVQGDQFFINKVNELSGGDIDITLHAGGALGYKSSDHFYAVADNAVQIADTLAGTMSGIDPIFLLSSLPFLVENEDQAELLYKIAKPYYEAVFEENDQILLYASPWPASGIWSKEKVDSQESLKGLKIRTYDKNGTLTLREAGASPIKLSWADVVPQLSTGGIDAVLTSADAGASASFWEHLDNYSAIQYAIPLNMVHMNRGEFDDLSAENQQAILEAAKLTDEHNWQTVRLRVQDNYKDLAKNSVAIHENLPAEFMRHLQDSAHPTLKTWLDNVGQRAEAILANFDVEK